MNVTLTIVANSPEELAPLAQLLTALSTNSRTQAPATQLVAEATTPVSGPSEDAELPAPPAVRKGPGRPTKAEVAAREEYAAALKRREEIKKVAEKPVKLVPEPAKPLSGMSQETFDQEQNALKDQLFGVMYLRGNEFVTELIQKYAGVNKFKWVPYGSWGKLLQEAYAENPTLSKHPEAITADEMTEAIVEGKRPYDQASQ